VNLGLSLHRSEMLPLTSAAMRRHRAVFLGEPPPPGFEGLLRGDVPIDEYLLPVDVEYPAFSSALCRLLRELHRQGIRSHQVAPFVDALLWVHDFFAGSRGPDDLSPNSFYRLVHRAEKVDGRKG
jgi:hypothetical protein